MLSDDMLRFVFVYGARFADALSGMIWTIRYHVSEDRWAFDYVGELLSVGGSHFGSTIQPLDLSAPGEFSYGE